MNGHAGNSAAGTMQRRGGLLLTGIAALAILTAAGGTTLLDVLCYQRTAILDGQLWRLLTASFVHLNMSHTLMNVAALLVIQGLFGAMFSWRAWLLLTLACTAGISLALLVMNPEVGNYAGLSGVLHGYFMAGICADRRRHPRTSAVLMLLVCSKLAWEQLAGPLPGSATLAGGTVIVDAHLYGAIMGLLAACTGLAPALPSATR